MHTTTPLLVLMLLKIMIVSEHLLHQATLPLVITALMQIMLVIKIQRSVYKLLKTSPLVPVILLLAHSHLRISPPGPIILPSVIKLELLTQAQKATTLSLVMLALSVMAAQILVSSELEQPEHKV